MIKSDNITNWWIFALEVLLTAFIPFIILWSITPTNVLNSCFLFGMLETIGLFGAGIIFVCGIPIGILGIRKVREMGRLKIVTLILSVINISTSSFEIFILLRIFWAVIVEGVTV